MLSKSLEQEFVLVSDLPVGFKNIHILASTFFLHKKKVKVF